ncbi:SDR family oxidoreductase [Paraburkholderia sp. BL10I2N1]|uniref:SDR family oxidoreductase n=1 Tax=Paraburkholderia sp. BL10I2N1 TaxID=1938796 RepID=UPI00105D082E|nr:SDR family oxidoreductase [Paraburkholderia sp. BL10I2N1]
MTVDFSFEDVHVLSCSIFKPKNQAKFNIYALSKPHSASAPPPNNAELAKVGLGALSDEDFAFSLKNKLMGQVNLVRCSVGHVSQGGSLTLTSGVLSQQPMEGSAAVSVVNAGVEAFTRSAALELRGKARVNTVSPGWIAETLASMGRDPANGVPAAVVAQAYKRSLGGDMTGDVIPAVQ